MPDLARARRTDPETSHAAAESVHDLGRRQAAVREALTILGPCTDEELAAEYAALFPHVPQSPSGLRTRRAELVAAGLVEWTGRKVRMTTGRLGRTWQVRP